MPQATPMVPVEKPVVSQPTPYLSLRSLLQAQIPIVVPCFNTVTYVCGMVEQLRSRGFKNIILVDNASTYGPMRTYLDAPGPGVTVIFQEHNKGPRDTFMDPASLALLPQIFCITDPDISLNTAMPDDFLAELAALTEQYRVGKAGLALDISDPARLRNEEFQIGNRHWKIWEWESQFWADPLGTTTFGDPVFRAPVATTFGVYNKTFFDPSNPLLAIRVAGRFTCRHLPWYPDTGLPPDEEQYYRRHARHSYYFGHPDTRIPS